MPHPDAGIVEPDEIGLQTALPYVGKMVGTYSDWTPLRDRGWLFPEDVDASDPWQFKNFRMV